MLNFLSPRGRIDRAPYLLVMVVLIALLAATVFVPALGWVRAAYDGQTRFSAGPGLWPAILLLWPLACLQLNRLRDAGLSLWWALAPVGVLAAAAVFVQASDGIRMMLNVVLMGNAAVRWSIPDVFPRSFFAVLWASVGCLGGIGWLSLAPTRKT